MRMGSDDVGFEINFDEAPAAKKLLKLMGMLEDMDKSTQSLTQNASGAFGMFGKLGSSLKDMGKTALSQAGGMAIFSMLKGAAGSLMDQIPQIGQAFASMKHTIMRNMVWPLLQHVLPIIIKIANWVRDNRILFVEFGIQILNAFRLIFHTAKALLSFVSSALSTFFKTIGSAEPTFAGFFDLMDLFMLKVAFGITFLRILLEPLIMGLARAIGHLWKDVASPFIDGFVSGMGDVAGPFLEMHALVSEVGRALDGMFGAMGGVSEIASALGALLATGVFFQIKLIVAQLKGLYYGIIKPLFAGLMEGLNEGEKGSVGMADGIKRFTKALKIGQKIILGVFKLLKKLAPVAKLLGYVIGRTLVNSFDALVWSVKGVVSVFDFFVELPNRIREAFRNVMSTIQGKFKDLRRFIDTKIMPLINELKKVMKGIFDKYKGTLLGKIVIGAAKTILPEGRGRPIAKSPAQSKAPTGASATTYSREGDNVQNFHQTNNFEVADNSAVSKVKKAVDDLRRDAQSTVRL